MMNIITILTVDLDRNASGGMPPHFMIAFSAFREFD